MQLFSAVAIISGLIAAVCWGTADFFAANASRKISPWLVTLFVNLITAASFSLVYLIGLNNNHSWAGGGILLALAAGVLFTFAVAAFYRGLSIGTVSIVSPIGAAYPLVTTLLVVLIFKASLGRSVLVGILLTVAGIMVTSGLLNLKRRELKLDAGVLMAIAAFVLWGVTFALLGKAVEILGWEDATFVQVWAMVIGCVALLPFINLHELFSTKALSIIRNRFIIGGGLLQPTGIIALNFGFLHSASPAIVTTVSACYPILTVLLALMFFKEKINLFTKIGVVVTIIGVAIISYR